ncbi:MAG: tail fiber domain-containing protein [Halioglobus sp.]|nr:tail fiber domain-containing protein [Halioglobus sp.]
MTMMSDRAAKKNIVRVATLAQGIGLYLFDYLDELRDLAGHGRQLGVMADEVESVMSEAVSMHPAGYKMVDYDLLAIKAREVALAFQGG